MCDKYNGWNNYETWNAMLWMNNTDGVMESIADGLQNRVQEYIDDDGNFEKEDFLQYSEIHIQEAFANVFIYQSEDPVSWHESNYGPISDAISTYFGMIDWREIAQAVYEDNKDHWKGAI